MPDEMAEKFFGPRFLPLRSIPPLFPESEGFRRVSFVPAPSSSILVLQEDKDKGKEKEVDEPLGSDAAGEVSVVLPTKQPQDEPSPVAETKLEDSVSHPEQHPRQEGGKTDSEFPTLDQAKDKPTPPIQTQRKTWAGAVRNEPMGRGSVPVPSTNESATRRAPQTTTLKLGAKPFVPRGRGRRGHK